MSIDERARCRISISYIYKNLSEEKQAKINQEIILCINIESKMHTYSIYTDLLDVVVVNFSTISARSLQMLCIISNYSSNIEHQQKERT